MPGNESTERHLPGEHGSLAREDMSADRRCISIRADQDVASYSIAIRKLNCDTAFVLSEPDKLISRMNGIGVIGQDSLKEKPMQIYPMHLQIAHALLLDERIAPAGIQNLT